jgi:hypothetical protein
MVELVDTADLKSAAIAWGFESPYPYQQKEKSMWKVQLLGCTKEQWLNSRKDQWDHRDLCESELSVIRTDNEHGQRSWGWDDETKLILPSLNPGSRGQRQKQYRQAELICEAFNNAGI